MGERKAKLEADRADLFPLWKTALTAARGNVSRAAVAFFPELTAVAARNKGNRLTRRFDLVEYAAGLRRGATGRDRGRQDR